MQIVGEQMQWSNRRTGDMGGHGRGDTVERGWPGPVTLLLLSNIHCVHLDPLPAISTDDTDLALCDLIIKYLSTVASGSLTLPSPFITLVKQEKQTKVSATEHCFLWTQPSPLCCDPNLCVNVGNG